MTKGDRKFKRRMECLQREYDRMCDRYRQENDCAGCPLKDKYPCHSGFFYIKGMERGRKGLFR